MAEGAVGAGVVERIGQPTLDLDADDNPADLIGRKPLRMQSREHREPGDNRDPRGDPIEERAPAPPPLRRAPERKHQGRSPRGPAPWRCARRLRVQPSASAVHATSPMKIARTTRVWIPICSIESAVAATATSNPPDENADLVAGNRVVSARPEREVDDQGSRYQPDPQVGRVFLSAATPASILFLNEAPIAGKLTRCRGSSLQRLKGVDLRRGGGLGLAGVGCERARHRPRFDGGRPVRRGGAERGRQQHWTRAVAGLAEAKELRRYGGPERARAGGPDGGGPRQLQPAAAEVKQGQEQGGASRRPSPRLPPRVRAGWGSSSYCFSSAPRSPPSRMGCGAV